MRREQSCQLSWATMSGWVWPGVSPARDGLAGGSWAPRRGPCPVAHGASTKLIFACRLVRIGPGPSRQFSHVHMEIQARAGGIANGETGRTLAHRHRDGCSGS